ncbi:gephyrin isoform X1 [Neodiprion pinetum]|uniref:gephyrin isoform X1 n=1 Tax=Neodiprion pinetum TaxID=441929 RepID=UPI001EE0815A|nr:gephyrin isoform X1 [Neodiprion pinetum]
MVNFLHWSYYEFEIVIVGMKIGIINSCYKKVSDTCASGNKTDNSGPELERLISSDLTETGQLIKGQVTCRTVVPDDEYQIMATLTRWSDIFKVNVILTTGGTGFSERDVTPEATKKILEKEAPGLSAAMLMASLKATPMGMLSRAVCGIRKKTLIVNLPGSTKAVKECFETIARVIPHAVDLILAERTKVTNTHTQMQNRQEHHCSHHQSTIFSARMASVADRLRESPYTMISVDAALGIISKSLHILDAEIINVWDSYGRVITDDIYAYCDLPPFRASIKDGYAVIASDGKGLRQVLGGTEAGQTPGTVKLVRGTCVRVNTGAPIPNEATAVVQVEDTKLIKTSNDGLEEGEIDILIEPKEGLDIRPIGSDIQNDSLILKAHTKIGAAEMGILAACGCTKVRVTQLSSVGVLSTGNELQQAGEPLKPGHVYDSNKITLMMMLRENGYSPKDCGIAKDDENAMINALKEALEEVDVLLTSGSVSMGDKDMLKPILENVFKATIHFGRVNMKPGKPTTYATCEHNGKTKYILCLPGNPVSAMVTGHLFALPLLKCLSGDSSKPVVVTAKLTTSYKLDPRPEYARAILIWEEEDPIPKAQSTGNQISSKLLSCKNANALLMLPGWTKERPQLKEGDLVNARLMGFNQNSA